MSTHKGSDRKIFHSTRIYDVQIAGLYSIFGVILSQLHGDPIVMLIAPTFIYMIHQLWVFTLSNNNYYFHLQLLP